MPRPGIPADSVTGAEFRTLRRAIGLDASSLAGLLGVPGRMIEQWESDKKPVPTEIAETMERLIEEEWNQAESIAAKCMDMPDPVLVIPRDGEVLSGVESGAWLALCSIVVPLVPGLRVIHAGTVPSEEVIRL